jgi:hypothetical protein
MENPLSASVSNATGNCLTCSNGSQTAHNDTARGSRAPVRHRVLATQKTPLGLIGAELQFLGIVSLRSRYVRQRQGIAY